jgi:hypothetical protein
MSTTVISTETLPSSPLLKKFFPAAMGCAGTCKFKFNGEEYVPDGENCGGDCRCPNPPASLRRLLWLEGRLRHLDEVFLPCCSFNCNQLEPAIDTYIELFIKHKLMIRCVVGLGVLSAMLLGAVVYLLLR